MHPQPPKWARKFLQWFCHPRLLEDMEGDLLELFHERVQTDGLANARRRYVWDVFRSLRPHHVQLKSVSPAKPLYLDMFRNYFLIALRQFWRNKVYSLLNVSGLAAGLAVSLLILVFVQHEFSYDRFHTRAERIYKMSGSFMYDGQSMNINGLGPAVAPALKDAHPEVVSFVRTSSMDRVLIGRGDTPEHRFREDKFLLADSSFLSVFSFRLLAGDPNTALTQPLSVLITPQMARKYFGEENPLGQTLSLILNPDPFFERRLVREVVPFTVSGIIEAPPSSSSLEYNFVASFQSIATIAKDQYDFPQLVIGNYPTYFLLNDASAAGEVTASLNQLVKPVMEGVNQHLSLEKLTDQHLHGGNSPANRNYLYIFAGVALLILLLALINYVSLTTARATQRSKEVGIRKVVGAKRPQLIAQFLGESFLMTLLAYVLAGGLVVGLLPVFQTLIGVSIPLTFLADFRFLLIALAVFLGSGLIAGTYPALLLSGLIPVAVLKGKFTSERGGAFLRRCFTTFQFAASVTLIICSLIMQNQLEFMRTTDIGLDKEHLLVIQLEAKNSGQNYRALTDELRRQSTVQWVTASTVVPFKGANMMFTETPDKKQISVCYNSVDEYFMDTFDIQWKVRPAGSPGKIRLYSTKRPLRNWALAMTRSGR
jgi:putative ABC transport system permease protein